MSAACPTCCPRSRACRSTPRPSPAACWAPRSRSTSSATTRSCALRSGRHRRPGRLLRHRHPDRPLDPRRDGHLPPDAARQHHPHRRLQVRPDPGRRQGHRLPRAVPTRAARASCACCPTPPAPRARATRRRSGRSARPSGASWKASRAGSSWPPSRATSRASSRCSMPRASSGARSRSSVDRWSRTPASRPTWATSTGAPGSRSPRTGSRTSPTARSASRRPGSQGEPMAGLARMANRDHRFVEIVPGDTVIVSASPIPGNEESVARTIDNLFKVGANVYYHAIRHAHVSGHASQEELKLMLNLTKPTQLHPDPRRVPDARPARPARGRDGRLARRTSSSSRTASRSSSSPMAASGAARPSRPAACSSTACRWARSATSCCATGGPSPTTACSSSWSPWTSRPAASSGHPEIVTRGFVGTPEPSLIAGATQRVDPGARRTRRPPQRDRPAQGTDQGQPVAVPVRPDASTSDGAAGGGRGLMASSGKGSRSSPRPAGSRPTSRRSRTTQASPNSPRTARAPLVAPGTVRSIVGIVLLVIGGRDAHRAVPRADRACSASS